MKKYLFTVLLIFIACNAFGAAKPVSKIKDHRIRTIAYDPNNITVLNTDYSVKTTVFLSPGEEILIKNSGKPTQWDIIPSGVLRHVFTVQPTSPMPDTNLTIVTNKGRTYLFELRAKDTWDLEDEDITIKLTFTYPNEVNAMLEKDAAIRIKQKEEKLKAEIEKAKKEKEERLSPEKIYLGYSFSGNDETSPLAVFDDGKFTYIQFEKNADLPAVYEVGNDLSETILNYRIEEPYMVIERIARRFSLRQGNNVTTVKREKEILSRKKAEELANQKKVKLEPQWW